MKSRFSSRKLAFAAIGGAFSLAFVTAAFFIRQISFSLNVIAAGGMLLPLTQKYYRETALSFFAVSAIGAIYTNIHILPFVMVTGAYTIAAVWMHEKKIKFFIKYPVLLVYSSFVFFVFYQLTDLLLIDLTAFRIGNLPPAAIYALLNILFTLIFVLYDYLIVYIYKRLIPLANKLMRP